MTEKKRYHDYLVEDILKYIEENDKMPWQKPWVSFDRFNGESKHVFRGSFNIMALMMYETMKGYSSPVYLTKGFVKKFRIPHTLGMVRLFKPIMGTYEDDEGNKKEYLRYWATTDYVNIEQLKEEEDRTKYEAMYEISEIPNAIPEIMQMMETITAKKGLEFRHGADGAYYAFKSNYVNIPDDRHFDSPGAWAQVVAHELAHWAGHVMPEKDWSATGSMFSPKYAREELIAELTSLEFLRRNHIAGGYQPIEHCGEYIRHWMGNIQADPDFLRNLMGLASTRVTWLTSNFYPKAEAVEESMELEIA